jgi:hypothetical protein
MRSKIIAILASVIMAGGVGLALASPAQAGDAPVKTAHKTSVINGVTYVEDRNYTKAEVNKIVARDTQLRNQALALEGQTASAATVSGLYYQIGQKDIWGGQFSVKIAELRVYWNGTYNQARTSHVGITWDVPYDTHVDICTVDSRGWCNSALNKDTGYYRLYAGPVRTAIPSAGRCISTSGSIVYPYRNGMGWTVYNTAFVNSFCG